MPYITPDYVHEPLYCISAYSNPIRYKAREKHYARFAKHIKDSGAILVTVDVAFGERHHSLDEGVTQHGTEIHQSAPEKPTEFHKARSTHDHIYVKLRTTSEIWNKENALNVGMQYLPPDAKYIAWVDADVMFTRPNWVGETIQQLQHYDFVQMFSHATDLGPKYQPIQNHLGFVYCYLHGVEKPPTLPGGYYGSTALRVDGAPIPWHPGYCWAARKEALNKVGGLIDFAILGAADNHQAHALIGEALSSVHPGMTDGYRNRVLQWEEFANAHIRQNVGYVSGLLVHYWHGKKVDRKYWDRWKILVENQFNPDTDLKYDTQGMLQLVDHGDRRSLRLRDAIRRYMRERNEDSVDL